MQVIIVILTKPSGCRASSLTSHYLVLATGHHIAEAPPAGALKPFGADRSEPIECTQCVPVNR